MLKRILCCGVLLILTGCMTVGPDYKRPAIDTPVAWRFEEKEIRDLANTAWWQQFNDPVLNGLVTTALEQNKDLLIATCSNFTQYGVAYLETEAAVLGEAQHLQERPDLRPSAGFRRAAAALPVSAS